MWTEDAHAVRDAGTAVVSIKHGCVGQQGMSSSRVRCGAQQMPMHLLWMRDAQRRSGLPVHPESDPEGHGVVAWSHSCTLSRPASASAPRWALSNVISSTRGHRCGSSRSPIHARADAGLEQPMLL